MASFLARSLLSLCAVVTVLLSMLPTQAHAQDGARMRVLIPPFVGADGKALRNGDRLADQLRREVNRMPRHAPVEMKQAEAQLKQFGVKRADMTCVMWKQLAARMNNVGLVLCGTIDESTGAVVASFEPVGGGADPFHVPSFTMASAEQAARHILDEFGTYIEGLQFAQNCHEFIQNESWQQALSDCERAIAVNPRSIGATYARGTALRGLGRLDEALDSYRTVLTIDALNMDGLMAAGYVAAQLGQQDTALAYFHRYLELEPDADQVRLVIASQLAKDGDPHAALKLLEEATAKPGASRSIVLYAGHFAMNAALMRRQTGPAADDNPDPAVRELMQQALTYYERAHALAPDSADGLLLRQMMVAYRGVGDTAKALDVGALATANGAGDAQTWLVYSEVLRESGQAQPALAALDEAQRLDETVQVNGRRAVILLDVGRLHDALAAARAGVAAGDVSADMAESISQRMTQLGLEHTTARRWEQAVSHYDAARQVGRSERSIGMANFFHGYTYYLQADALLRTATTAAPAQTAKPLLERARILMEGAGGYPDQEARRQEVMKSIAEYMTVADALIRSGR